MNAALASAPSRAAVRPYFAKPFILRGVVSA